MVGARDATEGGLTVTDDTDGYDPVTPDDHMAAQDDDVWDTDTEVACPYCGEQVTIGLDPSGGASQIYVEDCQVCCQPWRVHVNYDDHGVARVSIEAP